jgi:hypothetical protein
MIFIIKIKIKLKNQQKKAYKNRKVVVPYRIRTPEGSNMGVNGRMMV